MFLPTDGTVLLNAGTMSPTPRPVMEAAAEIREEQASNPHRFFFELQGKYVAKARTALAKYLRVQQGDLFLIPNVTIALNFPIYALDCAVREGALKRDTVLVSSLEYGSIALAWRNASALKVEVVPIHRCATWEEIIEAFRTRMNERTLAICVSHIAQPNGRVLPVKALAKLARQKGVFSLIDGAHAPGAMTLDLEDIAADAYGANVHKWMMGLANSGFLHVSKRMKDLLRPMFVSWGSKDLREDNRETFAPFYGGTQLQGAIEFWGCVDRVPQMVLPQTIEFLRLVGEPRMRERMKALSDQVRTALSPYLEPLVFDDPERAIALTAFKLPACDRRKVRDWFWKRKIAIGATRLREDVEGRPDEIADAGDREAYLRISTAWFNTEADIAALTKAVQSFTKNAKRWADR